MHLAEKIGTRRFRTFATLSAQSRHASRRKRRESAALPSITFRCRAFQIDSTQRLTNMRRDLAPGREPDAFHCADLGGDRLGGGLYQLSETLTHLTSQPKLIAKLATI